MEMNEGAGVLLLGLPSAGGGSLPGIGRGVVPISLRRRNAGAPSPTHRPGVFYDQAEGCRPASARTNGQPPPAWAEWSLAPPGVTTARETTSSDPASRHKQHGRDGR